jgi:hypothetical protein
MPEDIYWNPGTARVPWAGNTPFDGLSIARKGSSMKNILISGILETRGRPSPNGGYVSEKRRRPGHLRVQAAPQRRVRRPGSKNLDMRRLRRGPGNSGRDRDGRWVLACTEPPGAAPCRSGQLQSLRTVRSFTGQNSADSAPPSAIDNAWKSATFGRSAISCGSGNAAGAGEASDVRKASGTRKASVARSVPGAHRVLASHRRRPVHGLAARRRHFARRSALRRHRLRAPGKAAIRSALPPADRAFKHDDLATPFAFMVEGELTLSGYDALTGTIETYEGETFALHKAESASSDLHSEGFSPNIHYRCDPLGSCTLIAGQFVLNAQRTR